MKKKYLIVVLTLVMLTVPMLVSGEPINLGTLDYEESEIVVMTGNVTLNFSWSDTGVNDLAFLWRIYGSEDNLTILQIASLEIDYDHTFVNDTKEYVFKDNNTNKTYVISVDYSSINVPESYEDVLLEIIEEQNKTIADLKGENTNLTILLDEKNNTITILTLQRDQNVTKLQEQLALLLPLEIEIQELNGDIDTYKNRTLNQSREIHDLEWTIDEKDWTIDSKNETIMQLTNPWCMGYSIFNPLTYNNDNFFYFNYAGFLIGVVISAFVVIIVFRERIKELLHIKTSIKALGDVKHGQPDAFDSFMESQTEEIPKPTTKVSMTDIHTDIDTVLSARNV